MNQIKQLVSRIQLFLVFFLIDYYCVQQNRYSHANVDIELNENAQIYASLANGVGFVNQLSFNPISSYNNDDYKIDYNKLTNKKYLSKCPTTCENNIDGDHRIVECREFFAQNVFYNFNTTGYLCKCLYANEKFCLNDTAAALENTSSYEDEVITVGSAISAKTSVQQLPQLADAAERKNCLLVYVGMAVQGHNMVFRQWIDKENCFNLCLKFTIKNGQNFDCKSFEHWHRDCPASSSSSTNGVGESTNSSTTATTTTKICASFSHDNTLDNFDNIHSSKRKRNVKLDYCVLSNQTIRTAGKIFQKNEKVTYYEILCKHDELKPNVNSKTTGRTQAGTRTKTTQPRYSTTKSTKANNKQQKSSEKSPVDSTINDITDVESVPPNNNNNYIETNVNSSQCTFSTFNPCQNGGICIMVSKNRFICSCKEFFYGDFCELHSIFKKCFKNHMELTVYEGLAAEFQIKLTDLYVNNRQNPAECQLTEHNQTHHRVKIPYDKCSTIKSINDYETTYKNNLFSVVPLKRKNSNAYENNNKNFLGTFDCRFESNKPKNINIGMTNATEFAITNMMNTQNTIMTNDKITKSTSHCVIDLLNLRLKIFLDNSHRNELINYFTSTDLSESNDHYRMIHYERTLHTQLLIKFFDLDKLDKLNDELKYLYLTIDKCWLTRTQNSKLHLLQNLISNGCERKGVAFNFESGKNSIEFSFNFSQSIKNNKVPTVYLHCSMDICSDQAVKNKLFYSQFKMCDGMANACKSINKQSHKKKLTSNDYNYYDAYNTNLLKNKQLNADPYEAYGSQSFENDDDEERLGRYQRPDEEHDHESDHKQNDNLIDATNEIEYVRRRRRRRRREVNSDERIFTLKSSYNPIDKPNCHKLLHFGPIDLTEYFDKEKFRPNADEDSINTGTNTKKIGFTKNTSTSALRCKLSTRLASLLLFIYFILKFFLF